MKKIIIRKSGLFYEVFDDDAEIFHYLFDYKLINNRVGFPKNAIHKVINILEEKEISYEVIGEDKHDFKNKNQYLFYLGKSKDKIKMNLKIQKILEKLENKNENELWDILNKIMELVENDAK